MDAWPKYSGLTIAACIILPYVGLVRLLRWKRYNHLHAKYAHKINNLTPSDAQDVILLSSLWDMPGLYTYSLSFALFKSYGIPTISKILASTKELGSADRVSKRYADTEILISSWMQCPLSGIRERIASTEKPEFDPRGAIALARVNWLHSKYKISNDDYLYTLCLFILEPIDWAIRYGWRPLSPLECQAHLVFWTHVGTNMDIKGIPETLEDLRQWSNTYEEGHMVPAPSNRDVAQFTTDELLHAVPERFGLKSFGRKLTVCLLEERVRLAMMQPAQGRFLHALVKGVMHGSKYLHRYLSLPRASLLSAVDFYTQDTASGLPRLHPTRWQAKPWYKRKSNPLFDRFTVFIGFHDDVPGPQYKCDGFRLEEMGPTQMENSGHEEVMKAAAEMLGCPITGPWALNGGR